MRILLTGANGFIGRNLELFLSEKPQIEVSRFNRDSDESSLAHLIAQCDFIVHLAGINRPTDESDFFRVNEGLTERICRLAENSGKPLPIIFASSTQAEKENPYGKSKLGAEQILLDYQRRVGGNVYIYRLPGVMGKWARPEYNSVVATYCHHIINGLPIRIDDPDAPLSLVHIDDVVIDFIEKIMTLPEPAPSFERVSPQFETTVGELAEILIRFKESRESLSVSDVGSGFMRALYSTFLSYYREDKFTYKIPFAVDDRGVFAEFLKTENAGQVSFFTCQPGKTRGSHYHHTKTEKFIVVQGSAIFRFRNLLDQSIYEVTVSDKVPEVVESIPGWVHEIANPSNEETIVMIWANEVYNEEKSDTVKASVNEN